MDQLVTVDVVTSVVAVGAGELPKECWDKHWSLPRQCSEWTSSVAGMGRLLGILLTDVGVVRFRCCVERLMSLTLGAGGAQVVVVKPLR